MSQNRTIKAILALDYDKRALSGTQKAIDQLNASLDATRKRALTVETAAAGLKKELAELARQDAIEQIGRDFARAGEEGREFNAAVRETISRLAAVGASEGEIRSIARAYQDAATAANQAAEATANVQTKQATRGALGVFGSNLKGLPALQISGNFSTDAVGKILQVVDAGLLKLGPAGIVAGAAVVGVGLVFSKFADDMRKYNEKIEAQAKAFFGALDEAFQLIFEGATSEEIKKQQAQAETDAAAAQAQVDFLNNLKDGYEALQNEAVIDPIAFTVNRGEQIRGRIAGRDFLETETDGRIINIEQLNAAQEAANIALEEATSRVAGFDAVLDDTTLAANDAAAAQERALAGIARSTQQRSDIEAETMRFLEGATRETAQARIDAAQREIDRLAEANQVLNRLGGETATELAKNNQARIEEQILIRDTTQALLGLVGQTEIRNFFDSVTKEGRGLFEGAFNTVSSAFGSVVDGVVNQVDRIDDIQKKITDAENKTSAAIEAINAKLAEAENKALADRQEGFADAQEKYNDAREKQEITHRDRLLAINRRADTILANAIGNRDALAYFMGQQQRKTELKEETLANKRRLQEIDKALKQQTDQVVRRYNEQVEAARKAANASIAIENEKLRVLSQQLNAEITAINNAYNAQLRLAQNYHNARIAQDVAGANASLNVFSQFWNGFINMFSDEPGSSSSNPLIPTVVPYDGSATPSTDYSSDLTLLSAPKPTKSYGGSTGGSRTSSDGAVINMNVEGATVQTIEVVSRTQAMGVFGEVLTGLGL